MDELVAIFVMCSSALVLAAPILAIVALRRTGAKGALQRRIRRLENDVWQLTERLRETESPRGGRAQPPSVTPLALESPAEAAPPAPPHERAPAASLEEPWLREPGAPDREDLETGLELGPPIEPRPVAQPAAHAVAHEATASAPPAISTAPTAPSAPERRVDWERWIGVRGAAVLGGIVAALAGLLFFQHAIAQGWVTEPLRFGLGAAAGVGCVAAGQWLRPRGYRYAPDALVGAGAVILYAAFWAAHARYGLVPMIGAFAAMAAVTAGCCWLAYRHRSQIIAVLGLAGGFATPLLLSTGEDRPIGLFGYVLLLDLGFVLLGRSRRWPSLALLGFVGTLGLQALWVAFELDPHELPIALVMLASFAGLFAFVARPAQDGGGSGGPLWTASRALGLLFPFVFALYFASRADLSDPFWPTALLAAFLGAAACWLERERGLGALPLGAGAGTLGLFVARVVARAPADAADAWELVGLAVLVAVVFHAILELRRRQAGTAVYASPGQLPAAAPLLAFGLLLLMAWCAGLRPPTPVATWLTGLALFWCLLVRQAHVTPRPWLALPAALGAALGIVLVFGSHQPPHAAELLEPITAHGIVLGFALLALAFPWLSRAPAQRRFAWHAAAAFPVLPLLAMTDNRIYDTDPAARYLAVVVLLAVAIAGAATALSSGAWYAAAVALGVAVFWAWLPWRDPVDPDLVVTGLTLGGVLAAILTAWPLVLRARFRSSEVVWYPAALAAPLLFVPLARLLDAIAPRFQAIALLALPLALLDAGAAFASRSLGRTPVATYGAAAIGLAALGLAMQLDHLWEPISYSRFLIVGPALAAGGAALLWRRVDHALPKYLALAWGGFALLLMFVTFTAEGHYTRPDTRIVNVLAYVHLVPAAAFLVAAAAFARCEVQRARSWESSVYPKGQPLFATVAGAACAIAIFLWINLAVLDWYATGPRVEYPAERHQALDLTLSIAWALYALALLALGMARHHAGPRWLSLALLLFTIGKVFLRDLGDLGGLYRVASLAGLAISLILVSLAYQRFVFGREREDAVAAAAGNDGSGEAP